ncbi:hypothetical protein ACQKOF_02140 [Lysinibacillus sp. NPDC093190]|uniref:hypothetical protein n=1 Tax=Lysinibacillus sp. NPDC093190 TaxID=3390575 RepID=UPI003D02381D
MEKKIRYDTGKVHRVNLAIISILAVLICGPLIFSRAICSLIGNIVAMIVVVVIDVLTPDS